MIKLTKDILNFMEVNDNIAVRPNKVILKQPKEATITIPSKLYPLQNKKSIKLSQTELTEPLNEREALKAFDNISFEIGRCYGNMEKLEAEFKLAGLNKDLKIMTGWLLTPVGTPIHHAWAVYKDTHVMDPAGRLDHYNYMEESKDKSKESIRADMIQILKKGESEPNHTIMTCGQALPIFVYVGSETTPQEGRTLFNKLAKDFPNHPSYTKDGMNQFGESTIQQQIRQTK